LEWFEVEASSLRPPHARVSVTLPEGGTATGSFTGDGPIDAVFQAIDAATGVRAKLSDFTIGAVTEGQDALGEVSVVVEVDGFTGAGQGGSPRARARVARFRSLSRSTASPVPARGCPRTSSTRRLAPTCARFRSRSH